MYVSVIEAVLSEKGLNMRGSVSSGLLYTAMPRGDMVGSATFTDRLNNLHGEVMFGKIPGKEDDPLLHRTDTIRVEISEMLKEEVPRAASPEPAPSSSHSVTHPHSETLYLYQILSLQPVLRVRESSCMGCSATG